MTRQLISKTISYGAITANPDGTVDISKVSGVNPDLRVRPFFAEGSTISMREFLVGAFRNEMGIEAADPDLLIASSGGKVTTPSGMVLDGSLDKIEAPPVSDPGADPDGDRVTNELPVSLIDHMEYYLLHYFKPGVYKQTDQTEHGRKMFGKIGCASCHIQNLQIDHDRRVADVNTVYDPVNGNFNNLFATATAFFNSVDDGSGFPALKQPKLQPFLVTNIYTDFKRHDVGPGFYEKNYDGTITKQFITRPLWGVGSTSPYGHDGRSINLDEVILRHGGEAQGSRDAYARLDGEDQAAINTFLNSLIIFPPDDTASNLDPGNRNLVNFPQFGHGSIKLTILFNDPSIDLDAAARILKANSLTVESQGAALQAQWNNSPILTIRLARGAFVQQMAAKIGKDTPYVGELAKCDSCFEIRFDNLEEVLDEINTLIETQATLQSATGGFLFNAWNGRVSPSNQ